MTHRPTTGSVTTCRSRVALLESSDTPQPRETPWYLIELRQLERDDATQERDASSLKGHPASHEDEGE